MIPLEKPNLRRCFNFPAHATYDKYVSFLENFAPCISGFLSGIMFQGFCSVISDSIILIIDNVATYIIEINSPCR
jgi:hypothetical protein